MAAPFNNLLTKLEGAAGTVYAASTSPVPRFFGIDTDVRTLPNVTFIAAVGDEFPLGSGNYKCALTVRVCTSVDGGTSHDGLAATVFDVFKMDDLASSLSGAAADFTVLGINSYRRGEHTDERQQVSELEIECYACASDIS